MECRKAQKEYFYRLLSIEEREIGAAWREKTLFDLRKR